MDDKQSSQLCVPEDFAEWCRTLPKSVRQRLPVHSWELRQIWEGSVREAYRFARPWLDAKGVYHRHDGIDFPSSDACPYCQIQAVVDERDRLREAFYGIGADIACESCGEGVCKSSEHPDYRCHRCIRERLMKAFLNRKRTALEGKP